VFENWLCFSEHNNPSGIKAAFQREINGKLAQKHCNLETAWSKKLEYTFLFKILWELTKLQSLF